VSAVAERRRFTAEDKQKIDAILSLIQTGGEKAEQPVDRDFLLEDGNAPLFLLRYFGLDFGHRWERLNRDLVDFLENEPEGMWLLPAGHGKSTTILRWMVMVMAKEPQISFIFIEKSEPTALKRSNAILGQLQGNRQLIHDFGEFKGDDLWSARNFTIKQRPRFSDWPTLSVYGAKGAALGNRCNILIADDLVTTENSDSELMRNSLDEWWNQAAATCPSPLPLSKHDRYLRKLFLGGTTFSLDDLYHRIMKRDPNFKVLHLPAVDHEKNTLSPRFVWVEDMDELGRSADSNPQAAKLFADLKAKRVTNLYEFKMTKGTTAFNRRYQNRVSDPSTQKFPEVWLRGGSDEFSPAGGYPGCLDETYQMGEQVNPGWKYVTGFDPQSGSSTRDAARFACVTLGANPKEPTDIYLCDMDYGRYALESDNPERQTQTKVILDHVKRYGSRIALETNGVQAVYAGVLRKEAQRLGMTVSITGHWTSKRKVLDPELGIEAMQPMVENGKLHLPYLVPSDRRKVDELLEEFINWGVYPTKDIVMSFWFAWRVLQRTLKMTQQQWQPPQAIPVYRDYRPEIIYPPSWTEEQIAADKRGKPAPTEEEDEEL
jgi:hypothetical protein